MIRIGRKTFIEASVIKCNGYDVFIDCSCWVVYKDKKLVDPHLYDGLESAIKYCMEQK